MPAPKDFPNLKRAGMGRPKSQGDRVRLNTTIAATTKAYLSSNGERHQGKAIDNLLAEVRSLGVKVHYLEQQVEGLQQRLNGLTPTDLP
jgi:hypothetical protein